MHVSHVGGVVRSGAGKAGIGLLALVAFLAVAGPLISQDPTLETENVLRAPSSGHLLGTNEVGQDVWARLASGAKTSIFMALGVGFLSTILGALIGITAGLAGGLLERTAMRTADVLLVIPSIVLLILLSAYIEPGVAGLIVLISVLHWPAGARVLRSQTLTLKNRPHVHASRTFGAGMGHIIRRHILPDLGPLLVVSFIHRARTGVFMEAGLAFIGITAPGVVSWGTMIRNALSFYYTPAWSWWLLPPGLCLSLLILGLLLLGHSLEKVMDPRLKDA